jgi:hypothetical protein
MKAYSYRNDTYFITKAKEKALKKGLMHGNLKQFNKFGNT